MKIVRILKKTVFVVVILVLSVSLSGCALINIPFQLMGGLLKIISKLPMPPPGVF